MKPRCCCEERARLREQAEGPLRENLEAVKQLAPDLRNGKDYPRSPRETLAGYVLAARALDKCRAAIVGWQGEYRSNCPLDQTWLKFAEIDYAAFRAFVATGAGDEHVARWIGEHAKVRSRTDIVGWNNRQRDRRVSNLPPELHEQVEALVASAVPPNRVLYRLFDIYDFEEKRL
jgi:hypothetical protein